MFGFLKDVRKSFGSIFLFYYNGNGDFLVHVLDDEISEIEYPTQRTVSRTPIFYQGEKKYTQ